MRRAIVAAVLWAVVAASPAGAQVRTPQPAWRGFTIVAVAVVVVAILVIGALLIRGRRRGETPVEGPPGTPSDDAAPGPMPYEGDRRSG
jgi:hypothetical protein